jgi:hypothetical protein
MLGVVRVTARQLAAVGVALGLLMTSASAQQAADALAKELQNPLAALTIVPFQFNADFSLGPDQRGQSYTLNFQPVVPFRLSPSMNLISRTIIPFAGIVDVFSEDVWGLGDTTESLFFSPSQPGPGGLIWGVGPIFLLPTATDERLGGEKWGAGPTALALAQNDRWTTGGLVHHLWSFAGDEDQVDVNQTFLQPFAAYALGNGQAVRFDMPATYDWTAEQWNVPVNIGYSKVFFAGTQPMSFTAGVRYYFEGPENGPKWGLRTGITLLFPSK